MDKIKFYYGMSGTFKATLINKELSDKNLVLWSMIKPWKNLESNLLVNKIDNGNNLNYSALHLCNLELLCKECNRLNKNLLVERGVTDMIFYYIKETDNKLNEDTCTWIKSMVSKELDLCHDFKNVEKILLVQKDINFIENVIFKEYTRKDKFNSIDDYLISQEVYTKFTKKYNNITEIKEIISAKEFLESNGIKFKGL